MNIYHFLDYKDFLKQSLQEKKRHISAGFTYSRMARACGIQKTYLSRVLNSDNQHLSEDQLFAAADYLGLSKDQHKYLQLLRSHQKSDSAKYQAQLSLEIDKLRAANERSETYLTAEKTTSTSELASYYLDPNVMLVHLFMTVERFRTDIKAMARQLHLSEEYLTDILTKLEQMRLIQLTTNGYRLLKEDTHLPVDSPLYHPYRFMQRVKTLERIQRLGKDRTYNFSVVFSANEEVRKKIKVRFLSLLEEIETYAKEAPSEDVYQMNFDLFDWSIA